MAGVVVPYRGPLDPHSGRPVAEVEAERNAALKALQARQAAEQNVVRARDLGIYGESAYRDPTTSVNYNYNTGAGGGGAGGRTGSGGSAPYRGTGQPQAMPTVQEIQQYLPAPVPHATLPPRIEHPSRVDRSAAEAAAFGRAKDTVGQSTQGALKALRRQMSARGISGSGLESAGISDVVTRGEGELGDVARDQAIEGVRRDYAEADRNYAGDLSQRGEDVGFTSGQRGQDIQQSQGRASAIPALLSLILRNRTGAAY